ncbi:MAG: hypothetical protein ACOH5I_15820 [Oligoflexus sp.]
MSVWDHKIEGPPAKTFMVVRNEKKETTEIIEFPSYEAARVREREGWKSGHAGEIIICCAKDIDTLLLVYSEYDNWAPDAKKRPEV